MIITIISLILSLVFTTQFVYANTPTPNPVNLDEIQKIRQVVQDKVLEKIKDITDPESTKKGHIGTVSQINQNQILITHNSQNLTLIVNDDTTYIDSKRNKTQFDKIQVGQDVLAMGYLTEPNVLETKRLIFMDIKTIQSQEQVLIGAVVDASVSSPVFVLIPTQNKDQQYQITTDTKTIILDKNNKKPTDTTIVTGQKIICIIKPHPTMAKTFYAVKIFQQSIPTPTPVPEQ